MSEVNVLKIIGAPPVERSDAARNRERILQVAQGIVERDGPGALSMDLVAREASLGVGTVYRRFGDLSSLALALLDREERAFQGEFLSGQPPLGPGAPASQRLAAFISALLARTLKQLDLMVIAESQDVTARPRSPAYRLYCTHVSRLLEEIGGAWRGEACAGVLLAPLSGVNLAQQRAQGVSPAEMERALLLLVESVAGVPLGGRPDAERG